MKRCLAVTSFCILLVGMMFFSPACGLKNCVVNSLVINPVATPACVTYSDNFGNAGTLSNYDYFLNSTQAASNAAGCDYQITDGFLEVDPTSSPGTNNGGLAVVDNTYFSDSLTHYTITASFEMDNYTDGEGLFGIVFRTGSNGSFYCFQWNGNGGGDSWQIENNTGSPLVNFSYPMPNVTTPAYISGTTTTLQVVATGDKFLCSVNLNDGTGNHLIYNMTDGTYTSGGVGVRTYGVHEGNKIAVSNFSVDTCP